MPSEGFKNRPTDNGRGSLDNGRGSPDNGQRESLNNFLKGLYGIMNCDRVSHDDLTLEKLRSEHRLPQEETRVSRDDIGVPLTDTGRRKEAVKQLTDAINYITALTDHPVHDTTLKALKAVDAAYKAIDSN